MPGPRISVVTPTHRPTHLAETWASLKRQTYTNWEWDVFVNGEASIDDVRSIVGGSEMRVRVRVLPGVRQIKLPSCELPGEIRHVLDRAKAGDRAALMSIVAQSGRIEELAQAVAQTLPSVGDIKHQAFMASEGDVLLELDHDDVLAPEALERCAEAFADDEIDFVYSDCADFSDTGEPVTYHDPRQRPKWDANGWQFYEAVVNGERYTAARSWEPSAEALSLIYWAPNHFRAWKRDFYRRAGGHNRDFAVADDHELLLRTYLLGKMRHIPECLYLYRVTGLNTWLERTQLIAKLSYALRDEYLKLLVERECDLGGLPKLDLGGRFNPSKGWTSVDLKDADIIADLSATWPMDTNSVGAVRAVDFLEHLPDQRHTMQQIHRILRPGGWLLSSTPSTDGRGAFSDPTHRSFWNEASFWYWCRAEQAAYIDNTHVHFVESRLFTGFPTRWYREHQIPMVQFDGWALKGDCAHLPRARREF